MNREIEIVKLMENKQQYRKSRKHMEAVETSLFVCLPWLQRREPPLQRQHWFLEKVSREVKREKRRERARKGR
ncbi:hypothetical protein TSUD_163840 [Trifolium subterraneum]|uniref:Uncharacterized protein n=1 Tax=Trifolium subterraneum TaxID=3900 RepID=A0A2Z6P551_TRISU|nr:hypothetical protein TSUD_163840 [Trifolium subterraneum]